MTQPDPRRRQSAASRRRRLRIIVAVVSAFIAIFAAKVILDGKVPAGARIGIVIVGGLAMVAGVVFFMGGIRTPVPPKLRRRGTRFLAVGLIAVLVGLLITPAASSSTLTGSKPDAPVSTSTPTITSSNTVAPATQTADQNAEDGTALAALALLPVKGRAPKTGYNRDLFGQAWADVDRNGCDTRNDILGRDIAAAQFKPGTNNCVVVQGTLDDPYTGKVLTFVRGQGTSEAVQIDHVVALSDAWQTGAQGWDTTKRTLFANDPLNLLAVDGPSNMAKSDSDAASWLPPNKAYRCKYVARQVAVKVKYDAWVTAAEGAAIAGILATCPAEPLPLSEPGTPEPATDQPPATEPPVEPAPTTADAEHGSCDIKGNIASDGEKIYHVPGGRSYDETVITESKGERWFCSTSEAEAAGWRASQR